MIKQTAINLYSPVCYFYISFYTYKNKKTFGCLEHYVLYTTLSLYVQYVYFIDTCNGF